MHRLAAWWRRVFHEPAPLEYSAPADLRDTELSADRQAIIDTLSERQHQQANTITAETGKEYIVRLNALRAQVVAQTHGREQEQQG